MIEVIGSEGTSEYRAAIAIRDAFLKYWPGIDETPAEQDHVKIAASTKLSGYKVSDIDIVVAARLDRGRYIVPRVVLNDQDGRRLAGAKIRVQSFIAAIEVKDHDADGLQVSVGGVNVRYPDGWKSATEQNDAQRYALLEYLRDRTKKNPWVYRCVLLQGIQELPKERGRQLPSAAAVAANFDASTILAAMAALNGVAKLGSEYTIRSTDMETIEKVLDAPIFTAIVPSRLDRKRMDRIAARPDQARDIAQLLGEERIHLRGEGGTGKTVLLAQAAHEAFKALGKRSLFLTYNHALAADIQRILALMGVPSSSEAGGVDVRTVMSFTYAWLSRLGAIEEDEDLEFDQYTAKCSQALRYFDDGLLVDADIGRAKQEDFEQFEYDAILVDEAQDWPQPEADLLCRLYGGNAVSIADGMSQLVRGGATDWRSAVKGRPKTEMVPLRECLRMKANLGVFANAVAERAGLNWEIVPNTKAAGGRIILRKGMFHDMPDLHSRLLTSAAAEGNEPVDFLYCVPGSGIQLVGNNRASILGSRLEDRGLQVWDGVDPVARRDYPRSTNENRIVHYESCRGLEGWVTILDSLDDFWSARFDEAMRNAEQGNSMMGEEEQARATAWRWCMIALTRSIDTLVITVKDEGNEAARLIYGVAKDFPDIVEIAP